jgi:hypothetical protein
MARDPIDLRRYRATVPDDLNDPPRFSQMIETVKDAFQREIERFLETTGFTNERREELPTVRKYAVGFGPGTDPYETLAQITEEFPDILEALPHVAITAISGQHKRMTIGRPIIAQVQEPPRIEAVAEPYALADSTPEVWTVVVDTLVVGFTYLLGINGQITTYTAVLGDTTKTVALALVTQLQPCLGDLFGIILNGSTVTLRSLNGAQAFVPDVSANMTAAQISAAGGAEEPDRLHLRVAPKTETGQVPEEIEIVFSPVRFPTGAPVSAALAVDVGRVVREQSRNKVDAVVIDVGGTPGLRFLPIAPTPNEIEVLASSSENAVTVFGLGSFGTPALGDSITANEDGTAVLTIAAAPFTPAMASDKRFLTIEGATSGTNSGRFAITAATATTLTYTNPAAASEAYEAGRWFVGLRDDWRNPLRPPMNRYHICWTVSVTIGIYTESPTTRRELQDLIMGHLTFFLEEQFFAFLGRSVDNLADDPELAKEDYQISLHQEASNAGETDFPRPDDQKNRVYEARIQQPTTIWWHVDRTPEDGAGNPLYYTREDVLPDPTPC